MVTSKSAKYVLEKFGLVELIRLRNGMVLIDKMTYELMLETLDHVKLGFDGIVAVVSLS